MNWIKRKTNALENCKVVIWFDDSDNLFPINEWLHPGSIPIGNGLIDDFKQDLPNIEWLIRHLAWQGFVDITILSSLPFKGLDLIFRNEFDGINLDFYNGNLWDYISNIGKQKANHVLIIPGLIASNADFGAVLNLHKQSSNLASILTFRGINFRVGLASIQKSSSIIVKFEEKPFDSSQLSNSRILIISLNELSSKTMNNLINEFTENLEINQDIDNIRGNTDHFLHQLLNRMIDNKLLSSIELSGVNSDIWHTELSYLDGWLKLDFDKFIERFSHLYETNR